MIKQTIKYTDYNGVERTEDFYFNLTKAELTQMELEMPGGMSNVLNRIVKEERVPELIKIFKDLILRSYGVKSDDGKRFIKNKEVLDEFVQSEAYSELYMKLVTDAKAAADFINGIVPAALAAEVAKISTKEA